MKICSVTGSRVVLNRAFWGSQILELDAAVMWQADDVQDHVLGWARLVADDSADAPVDFHRAWRDESDNLCLCVDLIGEV